MSFVQARKDIVEAVEQARADLGRPLVVSYENQTLLDVPNTSEPYLCVEILALGSGQLDLGQSPWVEEQGQIHLIAHAPHNTGSVQAKDLLDHFRPYLELKTFSLVRTRTARGGPSRPVKGWECWPMVIPFWYHRLVT
jgi:hypothetical protein